jgi:hypothetical protein
MIRFLVRRVVCMLRLSTRAAIPTRVLLQGQQHILHNITFRNCTRAATGVTVNPFIMLTHSDEFVPEVRPRHADQLLCGCVDANAVIAGRSLV